MKTPSNLFITFLCFTVASCANVHNAMTALTAPNVSNQNARFAILTSDGNPVVQFDTKNSYNCSNYLTSVKKSYTYDKSNEDITCSSISFEKTLPQKGELTSVITNEKWSAAFLNFQACAALQQLLITNKAPNKLLCK